MDKHTASSLILVTRFQLRLSDLAKQYRLDNPTAKQNRKKNGVQIKLDKSHKRTTLGGCVNAGVCCRTLTFPALNYLSFRPANT